MGKPAARIGDKVLQMAPHCHAPVHPAALVPTPVPHPALPLPLIEVGAPTVKIGGMPAARLLDFTKMCQLPGCPVPGGPGIIMQGSATVTICGLPAARVGDQTMHPVCVVPIPSLFGKIMPPGCPTVTIGG